MSVPHGSTCYYVHALSKHDWPRHICYVVFARPHRRRRNFFSGENTLGSLISRRSLMTLKVYNLGSSRSRGKSRLHGTFLARRTATVMTSSILTRFCLHVFCVHFHVCRTRTWTFPWVTSRKPNCVSRTPYLAARLYWPISYLRLVFYAFLGADV